MKGCRQFLAIVSFVLGLTVFCPGVQAQSFIINATASASSVQVSNALTYTILVTNGFSATADPVFITNTFSFNPATTNVSLAFLDVFNFSNTPPAFIVTNSSPVSLLFGFQNVVAGAVMPIQFTVAVNSVGTLSNRIDVVGIVNAGTNTATTNLVTQVTGTTNPPVVVPADLTVSFTPPLDDVFVNDWITYTLTVSNLSSTTASNVFLTNGLPAGVGAISASPAPLAPFPSSTIRFSLGTLTNLAVRTFQVTVQTTNSGTKTFTAAVSTAGSDTNNSNNTATMDIVVSDFLPNQMVAVTNDATQTFNPQIGLMEQSIVLMNASTGSVASSRVIVSGVRQTDRLANAVGTNNGNPFVVHSAPLGAGDSVGMLLQFRVPSHQPFPLDNSNLVARAVTAFNISPPANLGTPVNPTFISDTISGRKLLEFPSITGRKYTVLYSDSPSMSNPKIVRPPLAAGANWSYWYDYGSPGTVSAPPVSTNRFYLIYLNPQ